MTSRPSPPNPTDPLPDPKPEASTQTPTSGYGSGSPLSPEWWSQKWKLAMRSNVPLPQCPRPLGLRISGAKSVDMTPLRLSDLEPPMPKFLASLPAGFKAMEWQLKKWSELRTTSDLAPLRQTDRQNMYWITIPSMEKESPIQGLLVSMPPDQIPGPRDRILLRAPWEDWPSRWAEVSPLGAFRMHPNMVDKLIDGASADGAVYVGMLAN